MKNIIKYNIGLDFGTYQSKVCVLHSSAKPEKHEFIEFTDAENKTTFFLPSRIEWLENDKFSYGFEKEIESKKIYNYFKIASAEDSEFKVVSGFKEENQIYSKKKNFDPFTPEFLSVLYLTNLLFFIKDKYKKENKDKIQGGGAIIKKYNLLPKASDTELQFSIQLGIPTEYSKKVNIIRRRKFETILLLSELLQKEVRTVDNFHNKTSKELIELIENLLKQIKKQAEETNFKDLLIKNSLSVFPETAAGLTFLVHKKKILPGFYCALDIGAGSSDISFFKVNKDYTISYLAAEAYIIAANNVYINYLDNYTTEQIKNAEENKINLDTYNYTTEQIKSAEEEIANYEILKDITNDFTDRYYIALKRVYKKLDQKIYKIFNSRVYWKFPKHKAVKQFENQPCFIYGGGSKLPEFNRFSEFILHDNGNKYALNYTKAIISNISEHIPEINILPQDKSWKNEFELLVTSFGLSFEHTEDKENYFWNVSDYQEKTERGLVPHPVNEGMFIYDVLLRSFETPMKYETQKDKISINSFSIKNFQGIKNIENIEIPENAQWTFLTGENGYGKTSVLRALLIGLYGNKDDKTILTEEDIYVKIKGNGIDNIISSKNDERFTQINQFAVYGTSRLNIEGADKKKTKTYNLFNADGILRNIEDGLIDWQNENQRKYYDKAKEILLKLLSPYIIDIEIKQEKSKNIVKYTERDSDKKLIFTELAAGFRSVIAIAGDIILRLSEQQDDIEDLKGIVIIDEFDLHLHPIWQKEMVMKFTENFPKIQFIVSTHSPIPLLGAPENSVLLLVDRNKEDGITLEKLDIKLSELPPENILSSPIFDFQDIFPSSHKEGERIRTEKGYDEVIFNKILEKKLQKIADEAGVELKNNNNK